MRFYQNTYPEKNDLVIAQVKTVSDNGVYVSLLEYNGIEGMVPISELTNRRFKTYHKLTKVGKIEILNVLQVDKVKGFIDLSKKSVSTEDIVKCEQKWNKSKCVQSIMSRVSDVLSIPLLQLHETITWPLYEKYGHAYDAFRLFKEGIIDLDFLDLSSLIKEHILENINKRLQHKIYKLRANIDLSCFTHEGIEAIKIALKEGKKVSDKVSITLISHPTFLLSLDTFDKEDGLRLLNLVCSTIKLKIEELGGNMNLLFIKEEENEKKYKNEYESNYYENYTYNNEDNEDNEDDEKNE